MRPKDTNEMRLTEKFVELYHNGDSHAYISHISHTLTSAHNSAISCRHSHLNVNTSICMVCVKTLNCNFISVFFFSLVSWQSERNAAKIEYFVYGRAKVKTETEANGNYTQNYTVILTFVI